MSFVYRVYCVCMVYIWYIGVCWLVCIGLLFVGSCFGLLILLFFVFWCFMKELESGRAMAVALLDARYEEMLESMSCLRSRVLRLVEELGSELSCIEVGARVGELLSELVGCVGGD